MTVSFSCGVEGAESIPGKESWREQDQTLGQLRQRVQPLQEGTRGTAQRGCWSARRLTTQTSEQGRHGLQPGWGTRQGQPPQAPEGREPWEGGLWWGPLVASAAAFGAKDAKRKDS